MWQNIKVRTGFYCKIFKTPRQLTTFAKNMSKNEYPIVYIRYNIDFSKMNNNILLKGLLSISALVNIPWESHYISLECEKLFQSVMHSTATTKTLACSLSTVFQSNSKQYFFFALQSTRIKIRKKIMNLFRCQRLYPECTIPDHVDIPNVSILIHPL